MLGQRPDRHVVDAGGRDLGGWNPPFAPGVIDPAHFRAILLVQNSLAMPAPVFRRDAYLATGGLDETLWYTPDWELWLKLGAQGPIVFDPRPATAFRIHAGAQTMTRSRAELAATARAIAALPHSLKAVLVLRTIEGLTQQETAEVLGITPKAVETRLYRARTKLSEAVRGARPSRV